ncbi:hypothetical protein V2G26_015702 [Clonostachys chloroleuca]
MLLLPKELLEQYQRGLKVPTKQLREMIYNLTTSASYMQPRSLLLCIIIRPEDIFPDKLWCWDRLNIQDLNEDDQVILPLGEYFCRLPSSGKGLCWSVGESDPCTGQVVYFLQLTLCS